ncbi:GNAT family N-acetyltransferase [Dokdonella sp. MW10]|uniref:GNAT family N-acetyltransferase n=1 Tax=Dokdonella sp. MW10 TaxID=2992926 RepID=UPI003F80D93A
MMMPMLPEPPDSSYRSALRPPRRSESASLPRQDATSRGRALAARDGRPLVLRPIRPDDVDALRRAFSRMTPEQVRMRVFHALNELPEPVARYMCNADPEKTAAFVVTDADGGEIRAEARVHFDPVSATAEFGIAVDPAFIGQGLGLALMLELVDASRARGMLGMWGDVLVENTPMLALTDRLAFARTPTPGDPGVLRLTLDL